MVSEHLVDLHESFHPMWLRGYRCVSCGNIVDSLIQRHRMVQRSHLRPVAPPPPVKAALFDLIKLTA